MIALNHQRTVFAFIGEKRAASRAGYLDIFLNREIVEHDFRKTGVRDFFAGSVKARRFKLNVHMLPETRGAARVGDRSVAFVALFAFAAGIIPALINSATIGDRSETFCFSQLSNNCTS